MPVIDIHLHNAKPEDPDLDEYMRQMDAGGVEKGLVHGVPATHFEDVGSNEWVARAVRRHPDRLFGSAVIDLRDPAAKTIETVRRYADEGFRSVKMFPNLGFDPNDDAHEPVWEVVEELGLMCLSHCGWLAPCERDPRTRISSLTATPFHFEVPARRHPKINFIFAHFGGGASYLETITLTSRLKNAFADTCPGWGRWVFENRLPGLAALDFQQVLYGTDNAGPRYAADIDWWTRALQDLGRSRDDVHAYFYGNAARLLKV